MSITSLQQLRERMTTDTKLSQKFSQAKNMEETVALAQELGYNITTEDIQNYHDDLPDCELGTVAGGGVTVTICENNVGKKTDSRCPSGFPYF